MHNFLFRCGDAPGVLASNDVSYGLWQFQVQFALKTSLLYKVYGDIAVDIAQYIQVNIDAVVNLDNVFFAIFFAYRVLNNRHAAIYFVQSQKLVYHHAFARLDVVKDDSVFYAVYIHDFSSIPFVYAPYALFMFSRNRISAMRMCLPQSAWKK